MVMKLGQFYWTHEMHCVSENELYKAQNWRIQHITLHPDKSRQQRAKSTGRRKGLSIFDDPIHAFHVRVVFPLRRHTASALKIPTPARI